MGDESEDFLREAAKVERGAEGGGSDALVCDDLGGAVAMYDARMNRVYDEILERRRDRADGRSAFLDLCSPSSGARDNAELWDLVEQEVNGERSPSPGRTQHVPGDVGGIFGRVSVPNHSHPDTGSRFRSPPGQHRPSPRVVLSRRPLLVPYTMAFSQAGDDDIVTCPICDQVMMKRDWEWGPAPKSAASQADHSSCVYTLTSDVYGQQYEVDRGQVWKEKAARNAERPARDRAFAPRAGAQLTCLLVFGPETA